MSYIFLFFIIFHSAFSATIKYSPGAGLNTDLSSENLSDSYKLRIKTSFSPVVGIRALVFDGKYKLRTGLYGEFKNVSAERTDPSLYDNDINATAWYGVVPLNFQAAVTENFYTFLGLAPHILVMKSCSNDSIIPEGCGSFSNASKFVNYSMLGLGFSKNKIDFELNYQHALSDNYNGVKIHTVQIILLKSI
jgi:hypothetical protein